jgi:L-alanine-DL-glutamate epimerase-like enolase superfamily enzyme
MKIASVEFIKVHPRLAERYGRRKVSMQGIDHRVVARVTTDSGIVGYGDVRVWPWWTPPLESFIGSLVGRNPAELLHEDFSSNFPPRLRVGATALTGALYDVLGKHLDVPAHALMGRKRRDSVAVAAWTTKASPEEFRDEISRAVADGYLIFKMHTADYYDVFEQTRLAEEVAPDGFKVHYDFNRAYVGNGRTVAEVLPIIEALGRDHPIVGWIEDPLPWNDIAGWRDLRRKSRIPIVQGGAGALGGLQEVTFGVADAYMLDPPIADALARGAAYGLANVQTIMQLTGGTLTKALALHIAAVLPTATGHSINMDDQYAEDITTETIPVVAGSSPVPDGPGLGFDVDEDALARLAAQKPNEIPRHVGVLHLPGGHKVYTPSYPDVPALTGREEGAIRGISFEIWEDDGSEEFREVHERVAREGSVRA